MASVHSSKTLTKSTIVYKKQVAHLPVDRKSTQKTERHPFLGCHHDSTDQKNETVFPRHSFLCGELTDTSDLETRARLSWKGWHLLQEASDVLLAAFRPCQWSRIILNLLGHDVWVPAHGLTVVLLSIMLDAKADPKHKNRSRQALNGRNSQVHPSDYKHGQQLLFLKSCLQSET